MKKIINALKKSKRVGIIAHVSPDPDCMGSMTALSCVLKDMGKEVKCFIDITRMPLNSDYYGFNESLSDNINADDFDTLVSVDVPSFKLLGKYGEVFKSFNNTITIDHHMARDLTAKYVYVDTNKSSCCEIIFDLIKGMKAEIKPCVASLLFSGLIGDTNCFENDNTNANTYMVAGELFNLGADTKEIVYKFVKRQTLEDVKVRKLAYENMVINNDIGYFIFTLKMQKTCRTDNVGNIVNEILNINDNKFAFIIKQKEKNTYTVSLRCKQGFNVAKIASNYGGGGHIQASGLSFVGSANKFAKKICDDCLAQIQESINV